MKVVLGIDVGTSGTKVIAVSEVGEILASCTENYDMMVPAPGFAEQDPEAWWRATILAIRSIVKQCEDQKTAFEVAGIGFSGQMHGLVPLDRTGNVIRPAIIWCDLRSVQQAEWLEREIGREQIIKWTENPPLPNFTVTKILWMREHEPDLYARIAHILLPKDYVRYKLTGRMAMDMADASGTLLLDVAQRRWSQPMCLATGIPFDWLPPLVESNEIAGTLTAEAATLLGLRQGTPVVAGAGDQAAGAVGLGVYQPGTVAGVFGTSGVVLAATAQPVRDPLGRLHTFCHAMPGLWYVMGVTQSAGGSLQWLRRRFGQLHEAEAQLTGRDVYDLLLAEAERSTAGARGLLFLPYLLGERTPHLDPQARGAWLGLRFEHELADLTRAVLEGVAFSLRDAWEVIRQLSPSTAPHWRVAGGGANGELWMEIFASVIGAPVEVAGAAAGPAMGAAILAAQGIGLLPVSAQAAADWVGQGQVIPPRAAWQPVYSDLYKVFTEAYGPVQASMRGLQPFAK